MVTALLFYYGTFGKGIESGPCLEVGGLLSLLSGILVKGGCMRQKGDSFGHHHCVDNILPSYTCELSPLFQLLDQTGWGFCQVTRPDQFYRIFLEVDFVYHLV